MNLLQPSEYASAADTIQEGDAGIILKPDGSFKIFSTGKIEEPLTPEQEMQGRKLLALTVALKTPQVMQLLTDMSNDPDIVGEEIDFRKQLN